MLEHMPASNKKSADIVDCNCTFSNKKKNMQMLC